MESDLYKNQVRRTLYCEYAGEGAGGRQRMAADAAVSLYEEALAICGPGDPLLRARLLAKLAIALRPYASEDAAPLERALEAFREAIPILRELGNPQEAAEAESCLGAVLQAGKNDAPADSIRPRWI
jgi:hypothetical protein